MGNACSGNTPVCLGAGNCKECSGTESRCSANFDILQTCDGSGNWISKACSLGCNTGERPHCNTPAQVGGIVACGDTNCQSGSEGCCASLGNFYCGACQSGEPQKTPQIMCDGNIDCGPNKCCMVAGPYAGAHFNTFCATDCGASVMGASIFYTCDPDFPHCPAGKTCSPWKDAETILHVCTPAN
jgi:hypothetical protein